MDDSMIIQLYWERNETAIRETETAYGKYCFSIADNILHSREDAEESVNDTFLHVWNAIPPTRPGRFKLFLARITRNLSFDRYKSMRRKKRGNSEMEMILEELDGCLSAEDTETAFFAKELENTLKEFIDSLPVREKSIFLRRYFFAESIPVIAKAFSLRENHILTILSRTRKKLKNYLQKEGYYV